jgi:acetyl-CoA carboxylase/biotin carboxylase 1
MVAWVVKMKTPEYPGVVRLYIANDVTVQSGSSWGREEDEIYYKASVYARTQVY